ncbi:GrpB protein-domain-containing protein [Xylariales sp. PMI_506]|nr:GrpB protein-domain-containing protein [Xylariales sp. PMI_506]
MPSPAEIRWITNQIDWHPNYIQRVSTRQPLPIEVVEPDPAWPATFELVASRIRDALGPIAVSVWHVGSTSVPGLPAKAVIDIDLVVPDPTDEAAYVPALEKAGFQFLSREPDWYERRFFGLHEPYTNLHVFGPSAAEPVRHTMFRDWLKTHPEDREMYAAVKRESAVASLEAGEVTGHQYNVRKSGVIMEIYARIFKAYGFVLDDSPAEEQKEQK